MIAQAPKPFIFVHIPKNAGTSIEAALLPLATGYADFRQLPARARRRHFLPRSGRQHKKLRDYAIEARGRGYFIFTIVRNPFDRAISQIAYLESNTPLGSHLFRGDWKTKLMTLARTKKSLNLHDLAANQVDYLHPGVRIPAPDFIGRFETLAVDWATICQQLELKPAPRLPHIFDRKDAQPFQAYYDSESREAIAAKYARDLAEFGYTFEGRRSA